MFVMLQKLVVSSRKVTSNGTAVVQYSTGRSVTCLLTCLVAVGLEKYGCVNSNMNVVDVGTSLALLVVTK